ncbi:glycosyltransferase family 2 protein [uncultured Ruthenibacterium sp.]|uniref:glycosyltransferase family 2 protein n=1 Tax=uncultured Ruthenibacterium sp. TaxID=1905347 RepID=UPI00349EC2BA
MKSCPHIYIAISCYGQENYIEDCLLHLLAQRGTFTAEVHVFDDASPDHTQERIEQILASNPDHPSMTFHLDYNSSNMGMPENTKQILRAMRACDADYCCILEGDDYWLSPFYLQKHIQILQEHPEYSMSNNQLLFLLENTEFETPCFRMREYPANVQNAQALTAEMQAYDNYSGNFSSNVYRRSVLQKIPEDFLDLPYVDDWFVNLLMAQYGGIACLKEPLSVYRVHGGGVWSGRKKEEKTSYEENNIWMRMRYVRTHFPHAYWQEFAHFSQVYAHLPMEGKLFYHGRNGQFNEEQCLRVYYSFADATHFEIKADLTSLPDDTQALRFDPCEGWMVRTRDLEIRVNDKICSVEPDAGARLDEDGSTLLATTDPIFYLHPKLPLFQRKLRSLEIRGQIWFYADEQDCKLR